MSVGELMPMSGVIDAPWDLVFKQTTPTGLSGNSVSTELGEPNWLVTVTVNLVPESELSREWSSFIRRRKGKSVTFTMPRFFRPRPFKGNLLGDSGLTVDGFNRSAGTVSLSGANSGHIFHAGDMISYFTANSGYWIGEVETTVQSSGGAATIQVTPPPFAPHPTAANPRTIKALGEFRLISSPSPSEAYNSRSFNFTAQQVVRG